MPETTSPIHLIEWPHAEHTLCNDVRIEGQVTTYPGKVTCFACRKAMREAESKRGVGAPTPLPQRQTPVLLKEIIATDKQLRDLHLDSLAAIVKRGLNADSGDAERDALVELADALHLTYDDETERYI